MSIFLILVIIALILAVLSIFFPDRRLRRIALCLICIALLLGHSGRVG
jgi:hypothetical protein